MWMMCFNLFSWPSLTSQLKLESLHLCLLPKMTWSCPLPADSLGALSDALRLDTLHHERNSSLELTFIESRGAQICDVVSPAGTKLHHPLFQMGWLVWKSVRILQNPWNLIVCALGSAPKQSFGLTHGFLHRFHPRIVHGSEISPKRTVNKRKSIFAVRPSRIASPGATNSDPVILSWQKFGNKNCWGQCPRVLFNTVWRLQSKVLGFFWLDLLHGSSYLWPSTDNIHLSHIKCIQMPSSRASRSNCLSFLGHLGLACLLDPQATGICQADLVELMLLIFCFWDLVQTDLYLNQQWVVASNYE